MAMHVRERSLAASCARRRLAFIALVTSAVLLAGAGAAEAATVAPEGHEFRMEIVTADREAFIVPGVVTIRCGAGSLTANVPMMPNEVGAAVFMDRVTPTVYDSRNCSVSEPWLFSETPAYPRGATMLMSGWTRAVPEVGLIALSRLTLRLTRRVGGPVCTIEFDMRFIEKRWMNPMNNNGEASMFWGGNNDFATLTPRDREGEVCIDRVTVARRIWSDIRGQWSVLDTRDRTRSITIR